MRWNRPAHAEENSAEVNLTPLIDVSLVLVVILLLATPLAFESSFGIRKTDATARRAAEVDKEARIELAIETDGTVRVNRDLIPLEDLGVVLKPLIARSSRDVTVRCAGAVSHGTFVKVLDITKQNGAREIAVAGS